MHRAAWRFPGGQLLAYPLEDQDVGVHRHADREGEPREPREAQRKAERGEPSRGVQHVQAERADRERAGEPVVEPQHEDHERNRQHGRAHAGVDRVQAE